jgi:hypothetical protein
MQNRFLASILLTILCLHIKNHENLGCDASNTADSHDLHRDPIKSTINATFNLTINATFEIESIWQRFSEFIRVVCAKCEKAKLDCGCSRGMENPPFQLLHEYTEFIIWASGLSSRSHHDDAASSVSCVLLDISQPTVTSVRLSVRLYYVVLYYIISCHLCHII